MTPFCLSLLHFHLDQEIAYRLKHCFFAKYSIGAKCLGGVSTYIYEDIDVPARLTWSPCCCEFPFSKSKPSSLKSPKLIRPLPILPLPILIAHLQRATRSLISADSAGVSTVMSSSIKNDDAMAKLARDPETVSNSLTSVSGDTNSCARMHPKHLSPDSQQTQRLLWRTP